MLRLLFLLFLTSAIDAQGNPESFLKAVEAYKNQKFSDAQELFVPLAKSHSDNPTILFNLGLTEYQLGNFGKALGLWRKARSLDPSYSPPQQAIAFTENQLFPDQKQDTFLLSIYNWLIELPLWFWWMAFFICFCISLYGSLEYSVKKKLPPQEWPIAVFVAIAGLLVTSFFAIQLFLQQNTEMGTVIEKNLVTRTNPSKTAPTLSELEEGQLVSITKTHDDWVQIKSLSGTPGWVPFDSLIIFKGQ